MRKVQRAFATGGAPGCGSGRGERTRTGREAAGQSIFGGLAPRLFPRSFPRAAREESRRPAVVLKLILGPSGNEPNRRCTTACIRVHHSAPEQGVRGVDRVTGRPRVQSCVLASGRDSGSSPNRKVGAAGSRDRCSHVARFDRSACSALELSKLNQSADSVAGSDMPSTGQCPKPQSALTRRCTPCAFPRCGDAQSRAAPL